MQYKTVFVSQSREDFRSKDVNAAVEKAMREVGLEPLTGRTESITEIHDVVIEDEFLHAVLVVVDEKHLDRQKAYMVPIKDLVEVWKLYGDKTTAKEAR